MTTTGGAVIEGATVASGAAAVAAPGVPSAALPTAAGPPAVLVQGLSRTHPARRGRRGRAVPAVLANDDVTFTVGRGEVFGLLGPNGAGKSTLVRQLVGVLRPDAGRLEVLGHDVGAQPALAPRLLAYLAQEEPALLELPVGLAVETTGRLRGMSRSAARTARDTVLDELGLAALARRPVSALSGGQRRLAQVATALVGDRPLLVLDEPTTGLDTAARRTVLDALVRRREEQGTTVVLVTHNVLEAEAVLDRVAVLDAGRVLACDTPGRLKALVSDQVRLELVWRSAPPYDDATVARLARSATVSGRRWSVRLPQDEAREALGRLTAGPAMAALDDFTLTTPSLEDVYLALGGRADDLERM